MNVVVVVSGGLAETLQAMSLVRAVASGPSGPPLVLCAPDGSDLLRGSDAIGEVQTIPALGGQPAGMPGRLWSALRFRRLDVALVCSERPGVRAAVYGAAVPRRIGCAAGFSNVLLTDTVACPPAENRQQAWLRLAEPLGLVPPTGPRLTPPPAAVAEAERHLLETGIGDGRLLVAVVPGSGFAGANAESWSPERFAHLANRLASRHGAGIVLLGDERDTGIAEAMRLDLAADMVDLCGRLDLATTAAVIARCDLLVSADTPLLHVAAAVGTPSVGLFARTDGRRRGAAGGEHRVVQAIPANGTLPSLEGIRVDDVLAAIEGAL